MIQRISVSGYKCLNNAEVVADRLNVLVGPNASGKSTILQTLLLLRQSAEQDGTVRALHLSGPLYEAGTVQDALHPAADYSVRIVLKVEEGELTFAFSNDKEDKDRASKRLISAQQVQTLPRVLSDRDEGFAYLNAERVGPRIMYSLPPDEFHLGGIVGKHGEYTAAVLARAANGSFIIGADEAFLRQLARAPRELDQLEVLADLLNSQGRLDTVTRVLLGWILPGADFDAQEQEQLDSASLRFIRDPLGTRTPVRATHIGFGLVYTLPILVAALALRPDGLLLVENPEAHLHPFSQSRVGVFLAMVAQTGRQIFLETHSDHVINGVRLALKYKLVDADHVRINFISRAANENESRITPVIPRQDGRLIEWPEGFFDQIESDLSKL